MKKKSEFMKNISKDLKKILDHTKELQLLLKQEDINLLQIKLSQKQTLKPMLPFKASKSKDVHLPASTITTTAHLPASSPNYLDHLHHPFINIQKNITCKSKLEKSIAQTINSPLPMKTVSTFQMNNTTCQRILPSAIQRKKEQNSKRLPLLIKRHNRNYNIDYNQLIIEPYYTERYESPLTDRMNYCHKSSIRKGLLPNKVEEYSFHKSLKLKNKRLFYHNNKIQSESKKKNRTIYNDDIYNDNNKKTIELKVIHHKPNGTIDL